MADREISNLPELEALTDDTLIPVYQPGAESPAQSMTGAQIREFADAAAAYQAERAEAAAARAEQAGTQPDWNQNDSEAKDYVKNRPFYNLSSMPEIEFYAEQVGNRFTSRNFAEKVSFYSFGLVAWKDYTVVYDGVEYSCRSFPYTTVLDVSVVAIGNPALTTDEIPGGVGADVPFYVVTNAYGGGEITCTTGGDHVIYISGVVKLPNEYLDEEYIKGMAGSQNWDDINGKPFTEKSQTVLAETEITSRDLMGNYGWQFNPDDWLSLTVGDTYRVRFDGVEYSCVVREISPGNKGFGNLACYSYSGEYDDFDTGEPFWVTETGMRTKEPGTYTVSIEQTLGWVIDEECIPDSIAKHRWVDISGKPFSSAGNIVMAETEFTAIDHMGYYGWQFTNDNPLTLTIGDAYTVRFDGVDYPCFVQKYYDAGYGYETGLGNPSLYVYSDNDYPDTGEPFWITPYFVKTRATGTFTIEITQKTDVIYESCIPDTIARVDAFPTETWTFELEDGTSVTKRVVVR